LISDSGERWKQIGEFAGFAVYAHLASIDETAESVHRLGCPYDPNADPISDSRLQRPIIDETHSRINMTSAISKF
jgi:hypothetical protein